MEPSGVAPPPSSSTGDTSAKVSVDPTAAAATVPPPSTLDDSDIQYTLETIMTAQTAHGQLLVDILDEIRTLQAELEHFRRSPPPPPPPPFDDGF